MSSYRRTSVFLNKNNNALIGSISSIRTSYSTRIHVASTEADESEPSIQNVDPRFMIIEKPPRPPPSPKKLAPVVAAPALVAKGENWSNGTTVKTQIHAPKQTNVSTVLVAEKRNFQNLKRHHITKSATRTNKLRSLSTTRPCVSNYEVSSTNEELFTPRRRRRTLKEKLRKLHTSMATSNQRTYDIHYAGCTNDSDDCCLHRQCSMGEHEFNVVNLCCKQEPVPVPPKPVAVVEHKCLAINRVGDGLDRPLKSEKSPQFTRTSAVCQHRKACQVNHIYKLVCPIILFTAISLTMLSVFYEINVVYQVWSVLATWFNTYSLIGLRRPLSKWELWMLFVNRCTDKIWGAMMRTF